MNCTVSPRRLLPALLAIGVAAGLSACSDGGSAESPLPEAASLRLLDVDCQELRAAGLFDAVQEDLLAFFAPGGFPVPEGASAITRFGVAAVRVTETADVLTSPLLDDRLDPADFPLLLVDTLRCATADANRGLIQLNRSLGPAAVTLGRSFLPPSETLLLEFEALLTQLNTLFIQLDGVLLPKQAALQPQAELYALVEQLQLLSTLTAELAASLSSLPEASADEMALQLFAQSLQGAANLLSAQLAEDPAAMQIAFQGPLQAMQGAVQALLVRPPSLDEPLAREAVPRLLQSLAALERGLLQALAAPLRSLLELLQR
jgi:hypothetical protein